MDENTAGRERVKNGMNNDNRYILTATVAVLGNRSVTRRIRGRFSKKDDGRVSDDHRERAWGRVHAQVRA